MTTVEALRAAVAAQGYRLAIDCKCCGRPLTADSSMSKRTGPQCLKKNPVHVSNLAGLDVNGVHAETPIQQTTEQEHQHATA